MSLPEVERKGELDADAATLARSGAYDQAYYQALLDIEKGSLDRSRSAAELVQKAAAAVGTLYAAILGVSFSVSSHRFPARGLVPAVFLGLAIGLSTAYVAFLPKRSEKVDLKPLHTSPPERMQNRLDNFYTVIERAVGRHGHWLRAGVVALALGVFLLPAPFLSLTGGDTMNPTGQAWPSPPVVTSTRDATLQAIVYKAQVDEAAARRQQTSESAADLAVWLAIAAVGLLLVLGTAILTAPEESS